MIGIRRSDALSTNAAGIVRRALSQLNGVPTEIPFLEAMVSKNFADLGLGVYAELQGPAGDDYGKIWVRREMVDPRTGLKRDFLVVQTNDEDEIIRDVTAGLVALASRETEVFRHTIADSPYRRVAAIQRHYAISLSPYKTRIRAFLDSPRWQEDSEIAFLQLIDETWAKEGESGRDADWRRYLHDMIKNNQPALTLSTSEAFQAELEDLAGYKYGITPTAADPIDNVKPMGWKTRSDDTEVGGEVPTVKQTAPVQPNAPVAPANTEAPGQYHVTVNPATREVNVQFAPPGAGTPAIGVGAEDVDKILKDLETPPTQKPQAKPQLEDVTVPVEF